MLLWLFRGIFIIVVISVLMVNAASKDPLRRRQLG